MNILRRLFPVYKYRIIGKSMHPTFKDGSVVLVNRMIYVLKKPKENDIIVLYDPRTGREVIKRITKISNDSYFVEGDNKKESTDSRVFGEVSKKLIIGRVI